MKLFEVIQKKTKTTTNEPDLSTFRRAFQDQMSGTQNVPQTRPTEHPKTRQRVPTPELKKASAASTRARTSQIDMPPEAARKMTFLQSLGLDDEISDEEAARRAGYEGEPTTVGAVPEPKTPGTELATIENMPSIINKEIAEQSPVEPEWHQVKNLPGYLQSGIRAMGRQVFGTYTNTPLEDIQVLANVGGQGPNSKREINAVASWLKDNAERDTQGEMDFSKSIPDYGAQFSIFKHEGYTFMVVQDFAGKYIYVWPSADEKSSQGTERSSIQSERGRLR